MISINIYRAPDARNPACWKPVAFAGFLTGVPGILTGFRATGAMNVMHGYFVSRYYTNMDMYMCMYMSMCIRVCLYMSMYM